MNAIPNDDGGPARPLQAVLSLLARREFGAAAALYAQLRRPILSPVAARRFQKLLDGERSVTVQEGIYFVGSASTVQLGAASSALGFLAQHGVPVDRCLVIEFASNPSNLAAALPLDADTVYLHLSGSDDIDLVAAAVHEFAHVVFRSGNRVLDEGAAHYFELLWQERFPAAAEARVAGIGASVDLRTLLAYEAHDDAYFELLLPGNNMRVHAIGALLFAKLISRLQMQGVRELYGRIFEEGGDADVATILEQDTGMSIERIEGVGQSSVEEQTPVIGEADVVVVEAAYVEGDTAKLMSYYEGLFRQTSARALSDARKAEAELLVLAAGAVERGVERVITRYEGAFVRARLLRHLAGSGRDSRYYLFRALMNIARATAEGSGLDGALLFDEAKTDLEIGLARDDRDPLVMSCLARIEWHSPQGGAEGKLRAIDLLRRISAIPAYAPLVQQTLRRCLAEAEGLGL